MSQSITMQHGATAHSVKTASKKSLTKMVLLVSGAMYSAALIVAMVYLIYKG